MTSAFRCKQFMVRHDRCAMKIGTDAILLGAWADAIEPKRILDIGTGSGIIALMVAQRFSAAHVTAVEVDWAASEQAHENFVASTFHDRLSLVHSSVQAFCPVDQFDLIVCNPPWFQNSLKPSDTSRAMARHSDSLSLAELAAAARRLLRPGGVLNLILPIEQAISFTALAAENALYCHRVCRVHPTPASPPKRQLLAFSNRPPEQAFCEEEIVVEVKPNQYSEAYKRLAKAFLLKL